MFPGLQLGANFADTGFVLSSVLAQLRLRRSHPLRRGRVCCGAFACRRFTGGVGLGRGTQAGNQVVRKPHLLPVDGLLLGLCVFQRQDDVLGKPDSGAGEPRRHELQVILEQAQGLEQRVDAREAAKKGGVRGGRGGGR